MTPSAASDRLVEVIRASFGLDLRGARFHGLLDCLAKVDADVERAAEAMLAATRARLGELVECTTNNETYFFRHGEQLDALGMMTGELSREHPKSGYRVWSAGCSSGEEPLSLAIVVREALMMAAGSRVSVLGTDLSREALKKAAIGRYTEWSFRGVSPDVRRRHFVVEGPELRPVDALRALVSYRHHNLLEGSPEPVPFDVVACRNVLIYFGPEMLEVAVGVLVDAVAPGGLLLLGPAESPAVRLPADFEPVFHDGTVIYRRRRGSELVWPTPEVRPSTAPPPRLATVPPRRPTERLQAAPPKRRSSLLMRAQGLADRRQLDEARDEVLAHRDELGNSAELHVLLAMIGLESGDTGQASAEIDLALRLDPDFAMAHYLQGSLMESLHETDAAEAAFRRALVALADLSPDDAVPASGGMSVADLARTIGAILESHRGGGG